MACSSKKLYSICQINQQLYLWQGILHINKWVNIYIKMICKWSALKWILCWVLGIYMRSASFNIFYKLILGFKKYILDVQNNNLSLVPQSIMIEKNKSQHISFRKMAFSWLFFFLEKKIYLFYNYAWNQLPCSLPLATDKSLLRHFMA